MKHYIMILCQIQYLNSKFFIKLRLVHPSGIIAVSSLTSSYRCNSVTLHRRNKKDSETHKCDVSEPLTNRYYYIGTALFRYKMFFLMKNLINPKNQTADDNRKSCIELYPRRNVGFYNSISIVSSFIIKRH